MLIVDADCVQCANTRLLLHIIGSFETRLAYSPAAALAIAGDFLPGIVLISTDLPQLTGYALASALRRCLRAHPARLIALTSEIAAADRGRALAAGFEQYLTSPVQPPALQRILMPKLQRHMHRFRASPARDARYKPVHGKLQLH